MKIPKPCTSSPLGRFQPDPMDVEATKRNGWKDLRILVISENDNRLDFVEREFIRRIGNRLYGGKHHG
ncbi:MAG: hypothetical protein GJU73_08935 [Ferrovum sp.]|nr:hypothetical protein [Ferrovum sp.]